MPTAPRYAPLARWTMRQIGRFWQGHPPVLCCGADLPGALPLTENPSNWMRTVRAACRVLLERDIEWAYVILDDHPPIAPVNAKVLASELPAAAREIGATSIVLGGYGPLNRPKARPCTIGGLELECLPSDEPWKLPLHPALWNVPRLLLVLDTLIERLPEEKQTAWSFERVGSNARDGGVPGEILSACWRVDGVRHADARARSLHDAGDRLLRAAIRFRGALQRRLGVGRAAEAFDSQFAGLFHPRIGPYPCFWSGVMKKGRLNADYVAYARIKRRPELIDGLAEAFAEGAAGR